MDISEPLIETDTDTPTFFRNREMVRLLLSEHSALATELYENERVIAAENDPFGLPPPSTENPPDNLAALFACELEQTTVPKTLKIKVVTFNASGKGPPKELRAVFDTGDADLFAVGLQELVEMRAGSIAASLWSGWEPLLRVWREAIKQSLRKSGLEFVLMADKNMMGLALLVFARKEVARQISGVEVKTVALGVMRTLGNKGSVAVRLNLMDASICFVTSHFASGKTNVDDRNSDFHLSVEKLDFKLNKWDYRIGGALLNSDTVIWFGDLNYRLQLKNESELGYVFSLIDRGELNELAQNDQLNNERSRNSVFAEFTEGEIAFAPTYKFVPGTLANYDKSEDGKQRMPAWCDRVLFKSNRLSLLEYDSVSAVRVSDHKPVCALFAARFRSFEPAALADFAARIGAKIGALKKVLRPKLSVFPTALEFAKMYFGVSVSRAIRVRNEGKSVLKVAVEVKCAPGGSAWAAALDRKLCVPLCRSKEARVEFKIDSKVVSRLRVEKSNPVLRAQIRLKIERGEDVVVQVKAVYMRSSFGCPLDFLCRINGPVRTATKLNENLRGICPQIERMCFFLIKNEISSFDKSSFEKIDQKITLVLQECLDTDKAFPSDTEAKNVLYLLARFLKYLPEPLFPLKYLYTQNKPGTVTELLNEAILKIDEVRRVNLMHILVTLKNIVAGKQSGFRANVVARFVYPIFRVKPTAQKFNSASIVLSKAISK